MVSAERLELPFTASETGVLPVRRNGIKLVGMVGVEPTDSRFLAEPICQFWYTPILVTVNVPSYDLWVFLLLEPLLFLDQLMVAATGFEPVFLP